jgi:hypothetical protein
VPARRGPYGAARRERRQPTDDHHDDDRRSESDEEESDEEESDERQQAGPGRRVTINRVIATSRAVAHPGTYFGVRSARTCVVACWPVMLCAAAGGHGLALAAVLSAGLFVERLPRTYDPWNGALALGGTALLLAV